jgi:regulator of protease activity HflC (stomatin/prohibitin superfamily)
MFDNVIGSITGIFVVVYEGQHALRFTLGRAQAVVGPGVNFKVPIFQKFEVADTRHTTLDLEPQVIQLRDDLVYEVDCKVLYQIVDLRKALIEVDDLVTGLRNRVVMAIQRVVGRQDRHSVRNTQKMIDEIVAELSPIEAQWGVHIIQLGFSNISPSPTTLEITQLELLAREKQDLYDRFVAAGMSEEAAVALVSGAVVAVHPDEPEPTRAAERRAELAVGGEAVEAAKAERQRAKQEAREEAGEEGDEEEQEEEG